MRALVALVLSFGSETRIGDLDRFPDNAAQVVVWADRRRAELLVELDSERDDPGFWTEMIEDNGRVLETWTILREAYDAQTTYARTCALEELRRAIGPLNYAFGRMPDPNPFPRRLHAPWIR